MTTINTILNYAKSCTCLVGVQYYYRGTANRSWRILAKDFNHKI